MAEAFIKLHRKMLEWEWYDDPNTCRVFIHCLLRANWKVGNWHGIEIQPGQFVTSLTKLSKETRLTIRQVRTSLSRLELTGEVTSKRHSKFRVITVNNWNEYQVSDKQTTSKRQATDTQADSQTTTIEEIKNKRIKEINNRGFTPPTVEDVRAYCQERNNGIDPETFVNFYESKGWMVGKSKMKDWKASVRTWERSRQTEKKDQKKKFDNFSQREYDFAELERIVSGN